MKVLTCTCIKGGVGKTTNVLHLAIAASLQKKANRILGIDLDPQANLTLSLISDLVDKRCYVDALLKGDFLSPIQTPFKNLHLIPSHMELTHIQDSGLLSRAGWEKLLLRALSQFREKYDYVFIDTPAAYFKLHTLALRASDAYLISMRPEAFSLLGFTESMYEIENLKKDLELDKPNFVGYILNGVPKAKRKAVERIRAEIGEKYLKDGYEIPQSSLFDEARWSEAETSSIFSITGTSDLQSIYLSAWKGISKRMEGI